MITFVLDVDGVLTNGKFLYSAEGKVMKEFGPDDSDALKLLSKFVHVVFMSQDSRGYKITEKRIKDMGFELLNIPSTNRADIIKRTFGLDNTIYMGDSFLDIPTAEACKWSICPANASSYLKTVVSYVTKTNGGERAVAEACFWIVKNILKYNVDDFIRGKL